MKSMNVVARSKRVAKSRAIRAIGRYYAPRFVNPWKRLPGHLQTHIKELATEAFCREHMQQQVLPQLQAAVVARYVKQIEAAGPQVDELTKQVDAVCDGSSAEGLGINDPAELLGTLDAIEYKYVRMAKATLEALNACCDVTGHWTETLNAKLTQQTLWEVRHHTVLLLLDTWLKRSAAAQKGFSESISAFRDRLGWLRTMWQ
jgi:phage gp36-like protein